MWVVFLTLWVGISSALKNSHDINVILFRSLQNQVVLEYSIKRYFGVETRLECLADCVNDSYCQTAFYRSEDGYCQTNAVPYRFDSNWQSAEGTEYWESTHDKCNINEGYTYSKVGKFCYKFHPKETLGWSEAWQKCKEEGGDLVSLDTMEKYHYIVETIRASPELLNTSAYYVGASDAEVEGSWYWVNGAAVTFPSKMWYPTEPSAAFATEDYAKIHNSNDQLLFDTGRQVLHSFICEINLNQ